MSDLPLKEIKIEQALKLDSSKYDITLKVDGTLMCYIDGNLISPRGINRNDRFGHIKKILDDAKFPNCMGEMHIPNGNVFSISSSENWGSGKFMPFDLMDNKIPYKDRIDIIKTKVAELNNESIVPLMIFPTIEEGWKFVQEANGEGLVIRNSSEWYKCKILREFKIPIKKWEPGSDKGTFVLQQLGPIAESRISGTSVGFVQQFLDIQKQGGVAMAEVEAPFVTESGKLFQPRLRRVFIQELEKDNIRCIDLRCEDAVMQSSDMQ